MGSVFFYVAALVVVVGGFGVVTTKNIVHAALFLLAALSGVAGLFVLLYAEFLALVQLLIYGGAITIVILFAVMLTHQGDYETKTETGRWPFAALAAGGLFLLMSGAFVADAERYDSTVRRAVPLKTLATDLFENWAVPFEIASVVLLVALIGAVVIGRTGPEEDATPAVEGESEDSYQAERPRRGQTRAQRHRRKNA